MRVLALETSTLAGGVALVDGERLVAEYLLDVSVTHSERLMAAVDRVLADARWAPRDLDGIAVSIGPGSFTGLRIGVSTAKGLAWALATGCDASGNISPCRPTSSRRGSPSPRCSSATAPRESRRRTRAGRRLRGGCRRRPAWPCSDASG
ncbi:MAG: tRNA (adenosine(37)-N6)-threonylcarbamoyltransferase complex dimerization subunit type 1 TsaB [Candidatus Rokuibacteriota bacterium]|nr:MAG: tRNA (adenosine(37)-N6)-threonylcarbamoyltransferase complex dimerization subunit type 1 TsaB [Candidatus Rokubacteria bacterium]